MNTKSLTIEQIQQIIAELILSKTDKVTKISEGSVFSGITYGIARISQKAIKDIAILESHLYPEFAHGEYLENIAIRMGLPARLPASGSSTWVRLIGEPGTEYSSEENKCYDSNGVTFLFERDFSIPPIGYTYEKVKSVEVGEKSNSQAFTINRVSPKPDGHLFITNEFSAQYGRDIESDEMLKIRIKNSLNCFSIKTLSHLEQILKNTLPELNVYRILNGGSDLGKTRLVVVSQNGVDYSNEEFELIDNALKDHFSIVDLRRFGSSDSGVVFDNPDWMYIDLDFRCQLDSSADPFLVRVDIQSRLFKLIDFRFFESGSSIEWVDILNIVKTTNGVRFVPSNFFTPNFDIFTQMTDIPRFRGFIMRDMNGVIISDSQNEINPIYYSNF